MTGLLLPALGVLVAAALLIACAGSSSLIRRPLARHRRRRDVPALVDSHLGRTR